MLWVSYVVRIDADGNDLISVGCEGRIVTTAISVCTLLETDFWLM